ncbi:type II toxin-antitoxin system HicB family antitoxin [Peptococcaceae bacterium 1198_IL3148]
MSVKNLDYYLSLPYKITLHPDKEECGFVVEIPELPGCISQGETKEEALAMIEDAKVGWLETAIELGIEIPEPVPEDDEFSGRFVLRLPKSLHRDLADRAKRENVSLNQLTTYLLSSALGKNMELRK